MVVLTPDFVYYPVGAEMQAWKQVNSIVMKNLMATPEWRASGYDGVSDLAKQMYGFKIQRYNYHWRGVRFVFDNDEDYTAFLLQHT